jgi:hypothetical protein
MIPRFNILCRALGYQPGTIEQQILRGYFIPRSSTTPGKARVWSQKDVYALAIFESLFSAGMPAPDACGLAYLAPPLGLLFAAPRPGMPPGGVKGWQVGWIHHFAKDIVEFGLWTKAKNIDTAVTLLDLEKTARRAAAAFEAASQIEIPAGELPTKPSRRKQLAAKRRPRGRS